MGTKAIAPLMTTRIKANSPMRTPRLGIIQRRSYVRMAKALCVKATKNLV